MAWKSARPAAALHDVAQELTDRSAALIEEGGKVPWKREWDPDLCTGPQAPVNAFTAEMYHGINVLSFGLDPRAIVLDSTAEFLVVMQSKACLYQ
jgi:antirestriction protein ArdC